MMDVKMQAKHKQRKRINLCWCQSFCRDILATKETEIVKKISPYLPNLEIVCPVTKDSN